MFESLMPLLVMPDHAPTLLHGTCDAVIEIQRAFGHEHRVPWGVSESGYNATDAQLNYQYRAFGVPGLGLKRGLGQDLVIAPYASAMAVMVAPAAAIANLRRLVAEGREGAYGLFEAIDYTPDRLPPGQQAAVVRSWMAHHQGMTLLSLVYRLLGQPMQRRFLRDPRLRATELLLQEKVPRSTPLTVPHADDAEPRRWDTANETPLRVHTSPATLLPEIHLLANSRYQVMVSAAGAGYSRWQGLAVTRWREDWTCDASGQFLYLRDRLAGHWWSATAQPKGGNVEHYEAVFTQGRAEFKRQHQEIGSLLDIAVSPEDDIEVRRLTLTNHGRASRIIEVTSYAEAVIASQAQDQAHPAFSNLFVTSELLPGRCAILLTRRPRSAGERPPWMLHLIACDGPEIGEPSFETSRPGFIGAAGTLAEPQAMAIERLAGSSGSVLDPIVAVRRTVRLAPDASVQLSVVTGMAETREQALRLIERYSERRIAERVFEMAWTHSQVVLRQLGASERDAQLFSRIAGSVIYPTSLRRQAAGAILANRRSLSGLWGYGISGDLPIVLLRLSGPERLDLVGEVGRAPRLLARQGIGCRPGGAGRGPLGLPPAAAAAGARTPGQRTRHGARPSGGGVRAASRAGRRGGSHPAAGRGPHPIQRCRRHAAGAVRESATSGAAAPASADQAAAAGRGPGLAARTARAGARQRPGRLHSGRT